SRVRKRIEGHVLEQLVLRSTREAPELPQALADLPRHFGELGRPEEDQRDHQQEYEFLWADVEHALDLPLLRPIIERLPTIGSPAFRPGSAAPTSDASSPVQ